MTAGRMDRLAEALERLITAKTNEIWMSVVIGFGLVMFLIWATQALFIAAREIARAGGM